MRIYRTVVNPETNVESNVSFCAANGLDAAKIPADNALRIGLLSIDVQEFAEHPNGGRIVDSDGNKPLLLPWRRVPLKSPPRKHNIHTKWVVR